MPNLPHQSISDTEGFGFDAARYAVDFRERGFAVWEGVFTESEVENLRRAIAAIPPREEVRRKRSVYGVRNLLEICPAVRDLAVDPRTRRRVTPLLGEGAFAVRAIFFDKTSDANWSLGWHQDNVISVSARKEVPGFTGWSCKAGVWQTQPPPEVLAEMVAIRIHLDDCAAANGALRVLPGSHRFGWLDGQLDAWKSRTEAVTCEVRLGGIVALAPLLLHASAPAEAARHRRVIHLEYAAGDLPGGLDWNQRIGRVPGTHRA